MNWLIFLQVLGVATGIVVWLAPLFAWMRLTLDRDWPMAGLLGSFFWIGLGMALAAGLMS